MLVVGGAGADREIALWIYPRLDSGGFYLCMVCLQSSG